jgi:hypothetical protein
MRLSGAEAPQGDDPGAVGFFWDSVRSQIEAALAIALGF